MQPNASIQQQWRNSVDGIYTAVVTMFICNLATGIISLFSGFAPFLLIGSIVAMLISASFMFSYYLNLGRWKRLISNQSDAQSVGYIRFYALFQVISASLGIVSTTIAIGEYLFLPYCITDVNSSAIDIFFTISTILNIVYGVVVAICFVGYILETIAAASLRNSTTMHERVRIGMNRIFISNILLIIGVVVIIFLAMLGGAAAVAGPAFAILILLAGVCLGIAVVVLRLTGWKCVSESDYIEEPTIDDSETLPIA